MTQKLKKNKATGNDFLPNDILKCNNILHVLYNLFIYCFVNHIVPHEWYKSSTPISYFEHDYLIADEQNSFRPGRLCIDHINLCFNKFNP